VRLRVENYDTQVLKLDVKSLPGKLVYESNPGGETKYWHLYHGSIPLKAVHAAEVLIVSPVSKK
jgi:uncharacterized protein (DUF952 family)